MWILGQWINYRSNVLNALGIGTGNWDIWQNA